jgi:hypothetical protein
MNELHMLKVNIKGSEKLQAVEEIRNTGNLLGEE